MEWMVLPLKRYADFSGRSRRMEYWMFTLGLIIFYFVLTVLFFMVAGTSDGEGMSAIAYLLIGVGSLIVLGLVIPGIAVQVRRFHDQDKSGWLWLINLVPYVGGLIVLVFMCLPGTAGPNRFGPDPKDPAGAQTLKDVFG